MLPCIQNQIVRNIFDEIKGCLENLQTVKLDATTSLSLSSRYKFCHGS